MKTDATSPADYVKRLEGWQRTRVTSLRRAVRAAAEFEEVIKWGHLVYFSNGPALLIRADGDRVLFGFWRGQRLRDIEPRLKPGGKYEMATVTLREGQTFKPATARQLAAQAALNAEHGNPQDAAKRR